jgi:cytochrome c553
MSERDEDTEGTEEPRPLGPRAARKAAQEAARAALEARVDAAPVDVGQFDGLPEPSTGARARVLAACERVARGATLADAAVLAGLERAMLKRRLHEYETGKAHEGTWCWAVGYSVARARALCRERWQGLAELGGKGSATAQWMLERRGGVEYRPPTQRTETRTTATSTQVTLSLEASLAETGARLGLDDAALAQMGEWLARAQTAGARGHALPAPPLVLDVEPAPEEPEE